MSFEGVRNLKVHPKARVGQIARVAVQDFFCHHSLQVDFGPHVNFIVGANGNGKSAVLAALALCLGGRLSSVDRGQNAASVIRYGQDRAVLRVVLTNQHGSTYTADGESVGQFVQPYSHDVFGDFITIERMISKGTAGTRYSVRATSGRTVCVGRKEIDKILEHMKIQLSNPATLLTQENVRQFLVQASDDDKYEFFLKCTGLKDIREMNHHTHLHLESIFTTVMQSENELKVTREKLKQEQQAAELADKFLEKEGLLNDIKKNMIWARVKAAKEKELNAERRWIAAQRRLNEEYGAKIAELQASIAENKAQMTALDSERSEIEGSIRKQNEQIAEARRILSVTDQKISRKHQEVREWNKRAMEAQGQVSECNKRLADRTQRVQSLIAEREQIEAQIAAIQRKKQEISSRIAELRTQCDAAREGSENERRELGKLDSRRSDIRRQIQDRDRSLKHLNDSLRNRILVYGDQMPALLQAIVKNQSRFSKLPIGPIGLLTKLTDFRWVNAYVGKLNRLLNSFIVESYKDMKLLEELRRSVGYRKGIEIIIMPFSSNLYRGVASEVPMSGLPGFRGQCSVPTMLKFLAFDDEYVSVSPVRYTDRNETWSTILNTIIDHRRVEGSLLVDTKEIAETIMFTRRADRSKEVLECFLPGGERFSCEGSTKLISPFIPSNERRWHVELSDSNRDQGSSIRTEIERLRADDDNVGRESEALRRKLAAFGDEERNLTRQLQNSKRELQQCDAQIDDLNEKISSTESDDVDELRKLVEEYEQDAVVARQREEESAGQATKLQSTKADIAKTIDEIFLQKAAEEKSLAELVNRNGQFAQEIIGWETDIMRLTERQRRGKDEAAQLEAVFKDFQRKAQELHAAALVKTNGDIKTPKETEPELQKHADELARQIQEVHTRLSSMNIADRAAGPEHYRRRVEMRQEEVDTREARFEKCNILYKQITAIYEDRKVIWKELRDKNSALANQNFRDLLRRRGHSGELEFDHLNSKLTTKVRLNVQQGEGRSVQEMRALSGGERSLTTIAFLLSLWACSSSPFRVMDECDVFMDEMNRRTAMNMIIFASKEKNEQIVLATPQDLSFIKRDDDICILTVQRPQA